MKKALQLLAVVKVMSMLLIAIMTVVIQGCQKEDTSGEGTSRPVNLANLNLQDANEIFAQNSSQSTRSGDDNGLFKITRSGEIVNVTLSGENGEEIQATNVGLLSLTQNYFLLSFDYPKIDDEGKQFLNGYFALVGKNDGRIFELHEQLHNTNPTEWNCIEDNKGNVYVISHSGLFKVISEGEIGPGEQEFIGWFPQIDSKGNISGECGYWQNNMHCFKPYDQESFLVSNDLFEKVEYSWEYKNALGIAIPRKEEGGFLYVSSNENYVVYADRKSEEIVIEEIPQTFTFETMPTAVGNSLVYNPISPISNKGYTRSDKSQSPNEIIVIGNDLTVKKIQIDDLSIYDNHYYTTNNFAYWVSEDWSIYEYSSAKQEVNKIFTADSSMNISIVEPFCVDNFVRFFVEQGGKKYIYIIQDGILSTYGETDEKYSYYANMTSLVAM